MTISTLLEGTSLDVDAEVVPLVARLGDDGGVFAPEGLLGDVAEHIALD